MQIRVIAPFRCHFALRDSQTAHHDRKYLAFSDSLHEWLTPRYIQQAYPHLSSVAVHHRTPESEDLRFWSLKEAGLTPLPHVFTVRPEQDNTLEQLAATVCDELSQSECEGSAVSLKADSVSFEIFDNTVAFLEYVLEMDSEWCLESPSLAFAAVSKCTNVLSQRLVSAYYNEALFPLLIDVARRDARSKFIEPPGEYGSFPEIEVVRPSFSRKRLIPAEETPAARVMWVNRSACLHGLDDQKATAWADEWIPLEGAEELRSELHRPGSIFIGWGHNSFQVPFESDEAGAAVASIRLAQYFYTVLFVTNENLSKCIGKSLAPQKYHELKDLQRQMKSIVPSVDLLVATYIDTSQTVQGVGRNYFLTASSRYSTDDVVNNIERKTKTVNGLIQRAFERSTRRTQTMLEVLVFALSGLALVDFTLNLTSVANSGRIKDLTKSHSADGVPGLLDIGAIFPADALLWFSSSLLLICLIIYLILHGRRS